MAEIKETKAKPEEDKKARTQSGIAYPYFNLEQSIKVAKTIHEKGGGVCSPDQLASFLDYKTVRSGTYLTRISSARLFGLITSQGGSIGITDRARLIISPVMPEDAAQAKIDAFFSVPLFKAIYDEFKGKTLPPEVGLKNLFERNYKIVKDRIAPAVRVFKESAEQAGLFSLSGDQSKLVIPPLTSVGAAVSETSNSEDLDVAPPPSPARVFYGGGGDDVPPGIDPALTGLLRRLPKPGPWSTVEKQRFLDAFIATFDFIYPESKD